MALGTAPFGHAGAISFSLTNSDEHGCLELRVSLCCNTRPSCGFIFWQTILNLHEHCQGGCLAACSRHRPVESLIRLFISLMCTGVRPVYWSTHLESASTTVYLKEEAVAQTWTKAVCHHVTLQCPARAAMARLGCTTRNLCLH